MEFDPRLHAVLSAHVIRRGIDQGRIFPVARLAPPVCVMGPPEDGIQPVDFMGLVTWINLSVVEVSVS